MKRRQLMGYTGAGFVTTLATNFAFNFQLVQAQSSGVSVQWLGHTCFLFTGGGVKILVNPFRTIGCTAKYRPIRIVADLVLYSSILADEGWVEELPGNPKLVNKPGVYDFKGMKIEGIAVDHDRKGGRRFGKNTVWKWQQGGVNILHLGGAAAPITIEQKILMGRPDLALVPVGGGEKAYNSQEAQQAISVLNPKLVIPTHYRTQAADSSACDISPVDDFLTLMQGTPIRRSNSDAIALKSNSLPEKTEIQLLSYKF